MTGPLVPLTLTETIDTVAVVATEAAGPEGRIGVRTTGIPKTELAVTAGTTGRHREGEEAMATAGGVGASGVGGAAA